MHILVYANSQAPSIGLVSSPGSNTTTTISSPLLRPRLEGQRGALRGDAYNAKLADSAKVLFTVRLPAGTNDVYNNYRALLTVQQSPLLGQNPETQFPSVTTDVSGYFAMEGQIVVDVSLYGTQRVSLQLTRLTDPTVVGANAASLFCMIQVLAEERSIDIENLPYMHDRGEV